MHYFWPFPLQRQSWVAMTDCTQSWKYFPTYFFKHRRQSLWGDFIHLYDFSYFLAPGGRHMLAHISLHSLRLLLNPVFPLRELIVGVYGQLLACGAQRTICRSSFPPSTMWVPRIKRRSGLWTILAAFLTHFQLNKSTATLNGISEGIHSKLSQTLFPFSVHNWRSRNHPLKLHFRSCYALPSLFPSSRLSVPLWPHCSSAVSLLDRPQSVVRPSSGLLLSTKQPHSNFSCLPVLQWVLLRSPLPQRQVSRTRTTEGVPSCHPLMSGACWPLQTMDLPRAVFLKFCFIFKLKKCFSTVIHFRTIT